MLRRTVPFLIALSALAISASRAGAQVVERPEPFDDLARVTVITPPLAQRLRLALPAWPVTGNYRDARLYARADGDYVIVVLRVSGEIERYALSGPERDRLRAAVTAAMELSGRPSGHDRSDMISEPARGAFARNQTILATTVYGPLAASLIDEDAGGAAAYLLVTGGTFFYTYGLSRNSSLSRAQNHLALHGGIKGGLTGLALSYAIGADDGFDNRNVRATVLVSAVSGAVAGGLAARSLTDAEAHGATLGFTTSATTMFGILGAAHDLDDREDLRPEVAAVVAAGFVGLPLGLRYVRRAPYTVTAGDVGTLTSSKLLGTLAASALVTEGDNDDGRLAFATTTAGHVAGLIAGDRLLVRRFDHTEGEARMLLIGTVAGGLMALAVPVLAESDNRHFILGMTTAGAVLGAVGTTNLTAPQRATPRPRRPRAVDIEDSPDSRASRVTFDPTGLALAAAGVRGHFSVLNVKF